MKPEPLDIAVIIALASIAWGVYQLQLPSAYNYIIFGSVLMTICLLKILGDK
jgi:hypothetical protein